MADHHPRMTEPDPRIVAALRGQLDQRRRLLQAGHERIGWKIALGIEEVERLVGAHPVVGYLTSATELPSGARQSATGAEELCVDAELAVRIGRDGAISGFAAALELVDLGQGRGSVESVLRANVLHRAFVLGAAHDEPAQGGRVFVNGNLERERAIAFDLDERVAATAAWLRALGERVEPGDWIITGSIIQVPVVPGDEVAVELVELDRLDVSIVD
jgi:2-keto-4-pentenoate hydratase